MRSIEGADGDAWSVTATKSPDILGCTAGSGATPDLRNLLPRDATILVPVDFSPLSHAGVETALQLAGNRPDVTIDVVHVMDEATSTRPEKMWHAQLALSELTEASDCQAQLDCDVLVGKPARALCEACRARGCSLIVLASHGRTGLARMCMGSVAENVVRDAQSSLLVLKPGHDGQGGLVPVVPTFNHLIVGHDGSAGAEQALGVARGVAGRFGSRITLVRAVEDEDEAVAAAALQEVCAKHLPESRSWRAVVAQGSTVEVLTGMAKDAAADMILIGPRRPTRWGHCLCDSCTGELIRRSACAVLALH
jgi:nucleotide-binding universal stress UspA family protein